MSDSQQCFTLSTLNDAYCDGLSGAIISSHHVPAETANILAKAYIKRTFENAAAAPAHFLARTAIHLAAGAAVVAGTGFWGQMTDTESRICGEMQDLMLAREPFSITGAIQNSFYHFTHDPLRVGLAIAGAFIAAALVCLNQAGKKLKPLDDGNLESINLDAGNYRNAGTRIARMTADIKAGGTIPGP